MELLHYPLAYRRIKTRSVSIGTVQIGDQHPICIQSMLTASTRDVRSCLEEMRSLVAVGCKVIRLTIPSRKDLEAVPELRYLMQEEGIEAMLVADIHFSPAIAVDACELFEKVRINPGNYSDSPRSRPSKLDEHAYDEGREILKEAIRPLVVKLIKYRRALRIGVNQGSLSSRMMERYGDSPVGMVFSALEMVELFEEQGFDQLVISLKSSNPVIVQKAYRLLVEKMKEREAIPLHLGVTEAGDGLMGRVKSLAGIGPLLMDGIGDTIRISLTEPSANEIVFANEVLPFWQPARQVAAGIDKNWARPLMHQRTHNGSRQIGGTTIGKASPLKIGVMQQSSLPDLETEVETDFSYQENNGLLTLEGLDCPAKLAEGEDDYASPNVDTGISAFVVPLPHVLYRLRNYYRMQEGKSKVPVGAALPAVIDYTVQTELASMLSEGLLDFILLPQSVDAEQLRTVLCILQATRSKIFFTDYITCPSCGRTLYDIQSTTAAIKQKTSHLKGLKIGIMGCIVNGPGEMADADFGYVGSGPGKVDLYFGQEKVRRGIDEQEAVERLIELIKEKGYWKEQ